MHKTLLVLFIVVILLSCKKTIIEKLEGDSFRISILPAEMQAFDRYQFTGTLDLRHTSDQVEYGLLVGKSINPTIENAIKFSIGHATGSVDFTKDLSGLDTGIVYYVRAYGTSKNAIQYSENQTIGKVSPSVYTLDAQLNYGRPIMVICNMPKLNSSASIKLFLNDTPINISTVNFGDAESIITASIPDELKPGNYNLSISVNSLKIVAKNSLKLFEGKWEQVHDLPGDIGWSNQVDDFFLIDDWVYINQLTPSSSGNYEVFVKYNYKTQETVKLSHFDNSSSLKGAAALKQGNLIHFLCGNANFISTKRHFVYNTTADTWTQEADFPGEAREGAISVVRNNRLYLGMGWREDYLTNHNPDVFIDMWSYDLSTKVWKKQKPFPEGKGRMFNASFTVGSKIYLTGGIPAQSGEASISSSKETWCYDTATDEWSRKADYPGAGAIRFWSFSIGNFGYVGMGESTTYNSYIGRDGASDMFKYDPVNDRWTEVSHVPSGIFNPFCGSNNSSGVVGGGANMNSFAAYQLFVYTPQN